MTFDTSGTVYCVSGRETLLVCDPRLRDIFHRPGSRFPADGERVAGLLVRHDEPGAGRHAPAGVERDLCRECGSGRVIWISMAAPRAGHSGSDK